MNDEETLQSSIEQKSGRHSNPQELLEILHDTAARLQNNAKYKQCIKVLTQALSLEIEVFGQDSNKAKESATKLIKMCNKLAVKMLKIGRFEDCIEFIGNALSLTGPRYLQNLISLRIVTLNNASSCHRRLGDMEKALSYAQDALNAGLKGEKDDSLACSHLNICCVYSQNGDHEEALRHSMDALAAANNSVRNNKNQGDGGESLLNVELDVNDPQRKQKLATLCIAYHNTGVELEHLKRYEECLEKYEKALQVSEMFLPENREMAASFRQSYKAARLIAAEYNVTHGRPKIPEKIVQRSKSSAGLRSGKKKKHNFRSTQNLHTKGKRPQSAGLSRRKKKNTTTKISYSFISETNQIPVDGALPPVQRTSSDENFSESKEDGTLEISKGSTTVLLSGAPSSQEESLNETRSREGELEKKLAMMQRRVAQLEAKLDPIENGSTIADSILFNKKLEEMHERRQQSITTMASSAKPKRRVKRRPQSASLARRKRGTRSSSSISSSKLSRTGMLITGPGITGGEGPKLGRRKKKKKKKTKVIVTVDDHIDEESHNDDIQIHEDHLDHITPTNKSNKTADGTITATNVVDDDESVAVPEVNDDTTGKRTKTKPTSPATRSRSPASRNEPRGTLRSRSPSPGRKSPAKFQKTPQKLTGQALVKFFSGQTVSNFTLKTYLKAHHSIATVEDDKGVSPLQALCGNDRVSKDMINQYLDVHPAHIEEAFIISKKDSRTALHYLSSNRQATLDTAKILISKFPGALNIKDKDGKTPLIIAYERNKRKSDENSAKFVKYLFKRSAIAHPTEKLGNNQLHQILMCLQRTTIKTEIAMDIAKELIALNPGLLLHKNNVDVTPSDLGKTSMSKKLQKFMKKATNELISKDLPNDALNLFEKSPVKKKKKKKMKKSNSRVNPFREPPPNYETMKPRHKEAKRVFYMLHEILEARHERPIIMFHRLDEDESGTVTQVELRKGLAGLEPPIKVTRRQVESVFKLLDTDGGGDLSYREIAREIKKVSRYPKPPPPTEEELEIKRKEEAEDKAARIIARKEKRKNRKKKKGPFLLTDEAGNFQVSRVFSKMYLNIEQKQMKIVDFFHAIDEDDSGIINGAELREGLKSQLKIELTNDQFKLVMDNIDEDHSDEIDYKELARIIKKADPRREASRIAREKKNRIALSKVKKKIKKKTKAELKKSSLLAGVLAEADKQQEVASEVAVVGTTILNGP